MADIDVLETRSKESKTKLVALIADIEAKPDHMECVANASRVLSRVLGDRLGSEDMPIGNGGLLARANRPRRIKA